VQWERSLSEFVKVIQTLESKCGQMFTDYPSNANEQLLPQPLLAEAAGQRLIAGRQEPILSARDVGNGTMSTNQETGRIPQQRSGPRRRQLGEMQVQFLSEVAEEKLACCL
jgi:hypothetical protein